MSLVGRLARAFAGGVRNLSEKSVWPRTAGLGSDRGARLVFPPPQPVSQSEPRLTCESPSPAVA